VVNVEESLGQAPSGKAEEAERHDAQQHLAEWLGQERLKGAP
jgi:hypothetical protein